MCKKCHVSDLYLHGGWGGDQVSKQFFAWNCLKYLGLQREITYGTPLPWGMVVVMGLNLKEVFH